MVDFEKYLQLAWEAVLVARSIKKPIFIAMLLMFSCVLSVYAQLDWLPLDRALSKAFSEGKLVVVNFYTPSNGWERMMEKPAYQEVKRLLLSDFILAKINAQGENFIFYKGRNVLERDLAQEFMLTAYPTLWFLDPAGNPLAALQGYGAPKDILSMFSYLKARK